jgi:hypothetical protein
VWARCLGLVRRLRRGATFLDSQLHRSPGLLFESCRDDRAQRRAERLKERDDEFAGVALRRPFEFYPAVGSDAKPRGSSRLGDRTNER